MPRTSRSPRPGAVTILRLRATMLPTLSSSILPVSAGAAPAQIGRVDEIRVGNIVARNLRIVTAPGLGELDVLGMNFLSKLQSWRVEGQTLVLVPHHPQDVAGK